jgi:retron-type reverse transcriptase
MRTIAQPAREVKGLQYWVMENFLHQFKVHPAATGYREGLNIADNARPHVHGRFLLKLDFKDFFPSLTAADFLFFLLRHKHGLEAGDIDALQRILFWKPKSTKLFCMSIGAPSSPLLSNVLLFEFDSQVARLCEANDVVYTRYADDMTFSADLSGKLEMVENGILQICKKIKRPRLVINPDKVARVSKKQARRVTGLVITNDAKVSLGRDQKRRIRAAVHHFSAGRLEDEAKQKLRGMLAFVKSVEPKFLARLRKKYGNSVIRRIQIGA